MDWWHVDLGSLAFDLVQLAGAETGRVAHLPGEGGHASNPTAGEACSADSPHGLALTGSLGGG